MNRQYPEGLSYADKRHIDAVDAIRATLRAELPEPTGDHIARRAIDNRNHDIMSTRVMDLDAELSRARVEMSQLALSPTQRFELKLREMLRDDLEGRHSTDDDELISEAVETVVESLERMRVVVEIGDSRPVTELESEGLWVGQLQTWDSELDEQRADRARLVIGLAEIDARIALLENELPPVVEPALDDPHSRGVLGD